jgi:fructan beta-fructosidase
MRNSFLFLTACATLLQVTPARADLLAYEGFNYSGPATNLFGLTGGSGWNGGWVNVTGGGTVNPGNLAANTNAPANYDSRSTGNSAFISNSNRSGRLLDCSLGGSLGSHGYVDSNGRIGADGKTLYVSFLQQPNSTLKFYEFEFHRGNLSDPGRIAGIGNDFNSTTVNWRAPNSTQTPIAWGSTNVSFYIVRIDFKPGNDDVYVYRNPTGNYESENEPALTMLSVSDMSFDGISLAAFLNSVTVRHDEIRLGETWGDVLGGPPLFVLQPTNQTAYVGQPVTLFAQANSKLPVNYQWFRGSNSLPITTSNLTLPNPQFSDADNYYVIASNSLGTSTSAVASLNVQLIGVSVAAQTPIAGAGSNLVLQASASGAAPLFFQWFKDGTALPEQTNLSLIKSNVSIFDAGQYFLIASNSSGSVTSQLITVYSNAGALLAYEGFDYPAGSGNLAGQAGGFGWDGSWMSIAGGSANVVAGNLSAAANGPAGFDSHSAGNKTFQPSETRSGRFLECSPGGIFESRGFIDANGNIGADGKTLYVSFVQQPDGTSKFYEFEFHRGDLGDSGRIAGIGNDTDATAVNFRAPDGSQTSLGAGSTSANFYILRIDFKPGNDDVHVYRNPTATNEQDATPTLVKLAVGDMSFNGISFGAFVNNRAVTHDEVRLGLSWGDVIGNSSSRLQLAAHTTGNSVVRLAGSPAYAYQLQASATLNGPWTNVARLTMPSTGTSSYADTNAASPQKFYRASGEPVVSGSQSSNTIYADFEGPDYAGWVATGAAFGTQPAQGALSGQMPVSGYLGAGLVNSYLNGDTSTGTLTSPAFTITSHYLNFLIGGGNHPGQTCINLLVNGTVVRTATGQDSETLTPAQWDISAFLGQTATLQIVDLATGSWGHILVDQIAFTDVPFPTNAPPFVVTNTLLNLPVKNSAPSHRVTLLVGTNVARDFDITLATGAPDWWAFVDVSAFQNQTATLLLDNKPASSTLLNSLVFTNGIVGASNLYQEALRPQFHFSSKRGWLNDANGMIFYQGQYHLYYQHDPFIWAGSQKYWGHAVSPDMVHWQELQEGIYSHSYHDDVWSGSAVVDSANTSGFKTGTNDVIVAAFYSAARGECIAYSNDHGLTFTDYTNNPVVVHTVVGRDPHLLWYAPSNYWVMAVYDGTGGNNISFYSSPDLKQWTFHSKIFGFFECPDLFQMPVDGNPNTQMWLLCDASSGYMLGQFDGAVFTPTTAKLAGNSGSAFYASQTFTTMPPGDSRRVRIGWEIYATPGMPFNQTMYFPTELTLQTLSTGVRLCYQPVREIQSLRQNEYAWTNLTLAAGSNPLSGIRGSLFDVSAQITPGTAQQITFSFQGITATYNTAAQTIACDGVTNPLPLMNGIVQIRILVDRDSIEIFGNNGQLYVPLPIHNPASSSLVSLSCTGGSATFNSLVVSELKSSWPQP